MTEQQWTTLLAVIRGERCMLRRRYASCCVNGKYPNLYYYGEGIDELGS